MSGFLSSLDEIVEAVFEPDTEEEWRRVFEREPEDWTKLVEDGSAWEKMLEQDKEFFRLSRKLTGRKRKN